MNKVSVYIHIPFCKKICSYCDFCKVLYNPNWVSNYLESLKKEIEDRYMGEPIKTIYVGGGTPSSLSISELKELFDILNLFHRNDVEEFTFECNIEDITLDLLKILKENHVNRLSIGIESFSKTKLDFMNRNCDYIDTVNKINLARKLGFNNINLDLIYALPNEKVGVLKKDLKKIVSLNPEHISTYSLMIEDNTYLNYQNISPIKDSVDLKMYDIIRKKLKAKKYEHYEISNFAKKGFESKHNLVYWNNEEYYGFGCGASGYIAGVRYDNTKSLTNYLKGEYKNNSEMLSEQSIMEYELILGLRKIEGINLQKFYEKYKINMQDVFPIKPLIKSGELIYENGYVKINPKKIYVMNEILLKLV